MDRTEALLDDVVNPEAPGLRVSPEDVDRRADEYFLKSRTIVAANLDCRVTYAVFLRTESVMAVEPCLRYIDAAYAEAPGGLDIPLSVKRLYREGTVVPAGKPLLYVTGSMARLLPLETTLLQNVGFPCVAAHNAMRMCQALPRATFLAMDARHCTGDDMHLLSEYGARVGSSTASLGGAVGFIGSSTKVGASLFDKDKGDGTMPHAIIGYAAALLRLRAAAGNPMPDGIRATEYALRLYVGSHPDERSYVALVDFDGAEITDALACCRWFFSEGPGTRGARLGFRLDTHGGRFLEGLDWGESVQTLMKWTHCGTPDEVVKRASDGFDIDDLDGLSKDDLRDKYLFGTGVTAAATVRFRKALDDAGYKKAFVVASSGFDVMKCRVFGNLMIPVDVVGTGSFLPARISKTYATADIVRYEFPDGNGGWHPHDLVKVGREHLLLKD